MSFYESPIRRLSIIKGVGLCGVSVAIVVTAVISSVDLLGYLFMFSFAGGCLLLGIYNLWAGLKARSDDFVTIIPEYAFEPEQKLYFHSVLWLLSIGFPVISVWTVYELNCLEDGNGDGILLFPVLTIYQHYGYWPAVITMPTIGGACILIVALRIRNNR